MQNLTPPPTSAEETLYGVPPYQPYQSYHQSYQQPYQQPYQQEPGVFSFEPGVFSFEPGTESDLSKSFAFGRESETTLPEEGDYDLPPELGAEETFFGTSDLTSWFYPTTERKLRTSEPQISLVENEEEEEEWQPYVSSQPRKRKEQEEKEAKIEAQQLEGKQKKKKVITIEEEEEEKEGSEAFGREQEPNGRTKEQEKKLNEEEAARNAQIDEETEREAREKKLESIKENMSIKLRGIVYFVFQKDLKLNKNN